MFMFRSRRTNLAKRLLKARKRRGGDGPRSSSEEDAESGDVSVLLSKLQENQLTMLWTAIESRGRDVSNCVLLPPEHQPHVLCCRTWRWPDLQDNELRRLPVCRSASDPVYICCNPYHWSRIYQFETSPSPPPYCRCPSEKLKPEDRAPSEEAWSMRNESLTTSGEDSYKNPLEWCKLAYWEMSQRVGPQFTVDTPAVNILGDVPYGDGLSLQTLAQHNFKPPESVINTRCKIGLGVTLSLEGGHVWVYNHSDSPIFVNSLTLDGSNSHLPTRVPAEQCLCVYDPIKAAHLNYDWDITNNCLGPVDPNSIRISFAKGWGGPKYRRQDITSCPCWLEVLLAPCR